MGSWRCGEFGGVGFGGVGFWGFGVRVEFVVSGSE